MPEPEISSTNGNRSIVCFVICVMLTAALIITIIAGFRAVITEGTPLFMFAVIASVTGLVFAVRAWRLKEEPFRYRVAVVFNAVMLFALIVIMAMFFFLRRYGQGVV